MSSHSEVGSSVEIDEAKQRLASAKKNISKWEKTMATAKEMLEISRKEAKEAEDFLKKAGESIDVDTNDTNDGYDSDEYRRKRRKVLGEETSFGEEHDEKAQAISGDASGAATGDGNESSSTKLFKEGEILIEGCRGVEEVNGIYKKSGNSDGVPMYIRDTIWRGKAATMEIYRLNYAGGGDGDVHHPIGKKDWFIQRHESDVLYIVEDNDSDMPPTSGWQRKNGNFGRYPLPQLRWK
mmetsp:Transcript_18793/g.30700  ORF Transcript_18793/g.30700 Transcript_18793/m.30700 type:complete len:238 (-) Transcript_18793:259-972(-)